ncbi:zinc finger protein 91-like [Uranotaenia lowii]|uniref:zinc finger protein 91-like n=1 Tax=Uranotaenia lowii TaxID=190385 RepID=UPI002478AC8E|nr:zinc finger protein 91-like [Uranotaenia lowii]
MLKSNQSTMTDDEAELVTSIKLEPLDADTGGSYNDEHWSVSQHSIENVREVASKSRKSKPSIERLWDMVVDWVHLRHVMLYEFRKGLNDATTFKIIRAVYGDQAPAEQTVSEYFTKFRLGHFNLKHLNDTQQDVPDSSDFECADQPELEDHSRQSSPASSVLEAAWGNELNNATTNDENQKKTYGQNQKKYECKVCHKNFKHNQTLKRHYEREHGNVQTLSNESLLPIEECNIVEEDPASTTSDSSELQESYIEEDVLNIGDPETSNYSFEEHSYSLPGDKVIESDDPSRIEEESNRNKERQTKNAVPNKVQCKICHRTFNRHFLLNRHYGKKHANKPELSDSEMKNAKQLEARDAALFVEMPCLELPENIFEENDATPEESAENFEDIYSCDQCPATFSLKTFLADHFVAHHLKKPRYECEFCGKRFFFGRQYEIHRKKDHLKQYNALLEERKLKTLPKNCLFQMDGCKIVEENSTKTPLEFSDVRDSCSAEIDPLKSEPDSSTFSEERSSTPTIDELNTSYSFNPMPQAKEVELVDIIGIDKMALLDSERNDKKLGKIRRKCKRCFTTVNGCLNRHMKTMHRDEQRFECKNCQKRFFRSAGLLLHQARCGANANERHNCDGCELTFKKEIFLKDHFTSKHLGKPRYECEFCEERFFYHQKYYTHRKNEHLEEYNALVKQKNVRNLPFNCLFKMDGCKVVEEGILLENEQTGSKLDTNESQTVVSNLSENETNKPERQAHECRSCHKSFDTTYNLDRHYALMHENGPQYECDKCRKLFSKAERFEEHLRLSSCNKFVRKFSCNRCPFTFDYMQHLKDHFAAKHLKRHRYECEFCGERFFYVQKYANHRRSKHREEYEALLKQSNLNRLPHNCLFRIDRGQFSETCEEIPSVEIPPSTSTSTIDELTASLSFKPILQSKEREFGETNDKKLENKGRKCKRCFQTVTGCLKRHMATMHRDQQRYECKNCQKRFFRSAGFLAHRTRCGANAKERYKCDECELTFKREIFLWNHFTSKHLNKPRYECEFCEERFFYHQKYYNHRKNKHPEKYKALVKQMNVRSLPLNCLFKMDGCKVVEEGILLENEQTGSKLETNESQTVVSNLSENETNKPEKQAHKCRLCHKSFDTTYNLDRHYASMHENEPQYECDECNKRFLKAERFEEHLRNSKCNKLGRNYSCNRCPFTFDHMQHLKDHFAANHLKKHRYECEFCGERFFYVQKYANHRTSKHREEYEALLKRSNVNRLPLNYLFRMDRGQMWVTVEEMPSAEIPLSISILNIDELAASYSFTPEPQAGEMPDDLIEVNDEEFWNDEPCDPEENNKKRAKKILKCKRCFKTVFGCLKPHMEAMHKDEQRYECKKCHKRFFRSAGFVVHQRRCAANKERYKCDRCELTFKRKVSLWDHFSSKHLGKPRYECEFCGERFKRNQKYIVHRKTNHFEEYNALLKEKNVSVLPFNCLFKMDGCKIVEQSIRSVNEQPGSKLKTNESQAAVSNQSENETYECRLCHETFYSISNLDFHYESMHENDPQYECEHCKKRFLRSEGHKTHQKVCRFNKLRTKYKCHKLPFYI